jgi:serine/threonine-protein kinase
MSLADGNQILMTRAAFDNARPVLKGEDIDGVGALSWMNHGPYLLKGVEQPLEICEVGESDKAILKPPPDSEKVHRFISPDSEPVLGWRPALGQAVPKTEWLLEEKLGEGGFGEVWVARNDKLNERRVFKFCFRADRVRSLKREVTIFRVLKERVGEHPNIVKVHDVYFDEPPFYIVMDYAAGRDLAKWCERRIGETLPVNTRLEIIAQAADGLRAAHDAGVIHRDVKPSNILVCNDGAAGRIQVKLTDFGIGQVVSQEVLAGLPRMGFTQTIMASGSPQTGTQMYMAPELLAGKSASTRSDIYSLGVVLYQLLVGDFKRPLTMDWGRGVTEQLLREDLDHCFAGEPQERFGSAAELASSLRALEKRRQGVVREKAEQHRRERAAYRRGVLRTATLATCVVVFIGVLALYAVNLRALLEKLVEDYRQDLVGSRNKLYSSGQAKETEKALQRALVVLEKLVVEFPTAPDYRHDLADSYDQLGALLRDAGRAKEAEAAYQRSLELWEKLVEEFPSVRDYKHHLGENYNILGLLDRAGRTNEAARAFRRALAVQEKLVSEFPDVPTYRQELGASHHNLGDLLRTFEPKEAEEAYEQALAVRERLVTQFPGLPGYQSDLGVTLNNLTLLFRDHRRFDEARPLLERAIDLQRNALEADSHSPTYRRFLRNHYWGLAIATSQQGDHKAVAAAARELPKLFPESWEEYHRAACFTAACVSIAVNDEKISIAERKQLGEEYGAHAVELLRQAIAKGYKDGASLAEQEDFAAIRDWPEFQKLVSKIQLPIKVSDK